MPTKSLPLSTILTFDAVTCAGMGLALLIGAVPLGMILDLPVDLLRLAGAVLLPFAVLLGWAGRRQNPARPMVLALIVGNAGWAIGSVAVLASGAVQPSALGTLFVLFQAVVVAAFTLAEALAVRRQPRAAA